MNLQSIENILLDQEKDKLLEIKEELIETWHKNQLFRTATEARYGVLNDLLFPTKAAKYWQSVREQIAHFDELTRLSFEMRRKEIDLKEVVYKLSTAEGYERERLEIDRDELLFQKAYAERIAKDRVREILQWSTLKKEFNDGSFDDTDPNTHQKESLFKIALNKGSDLSSLTAQERLTIKGLLHMLKDEPVNKELLKNLQKSKE